jgi:hypothetical protein
MLRYAIALTEEFPDLCSHPDPCPSLFCVHHTWDRRGQAADAEFLIGLALLRSDFGLHGGSCGAFVLAVQRVEI